MVEAESKAKPLSDNKIAKELEKQGHIVARRTVAKAIPHASRIRRTAP